MPFPPCLRALKPVLNGETTDRRLIFRVFFGEEVFVIVHIPTETAHRALSLRSAVVGSSGDILRLD